MTIIGHFVDASTGETIERNLNKEELDLLKTNQEYAAEKAAEDKAKAEAKKAVLAKLGLTADEVALLLS
jgi:hypothetical protein